MYIIALLCHFSREKKKWVCCLQVTRRMKSHRKWKAESLRASRHSRRGRRGRSQTLAAARVAIFPSAAAPPLERAAWKLEWPVVARRGSFPLSSGGSARARPSRPLVGARRCSDSWRRRREATDPVSPRPDPVAVQRGRAPVCREAVAGADWGARSGGRISVAGRKADARSCWRPAGAGC